MRRRRIRRRIKRKTRRIRKIRKIRRPIRKRRVTALVQSQRRGRLLLMGFMRRSGRFDQSCSF